MRLEAAIAGDLRRIMREEIEGARKAVVAGLRQAGTELRDNLKSHTQEAGLGALGRAWAVKVYRGRSAFSSAALVYPKGRGARAALWALEHGETIRPANGRYLAVPTQFTRRLGRRGGRVIYRPAELKDSFVARGPGGDLLLFARLQHAQRKTQGGTIREWRGEHAHPRQRPGRRTRELLRHGVVPMFILKPQVRIEKRLGHRRRAARAADRAAELILLRWNEAREAAMADSRRESALKALLTLLQGIAWTNAPAPRSSATRPRRGRSRPAVWYPCATAIRGSRGLPVAAGLRLRARGRGDRAISGADAATRDAWIDALLRDVGGALAADPTLGGTVEMASPGAPDAMDEPVEGAAAIKAVRVPVVLDYVTDSPLG